MTYEELAWVLVPALGWEYRLRHGNGQRQCYEFLVEVGVLGANELPQAELSEDELLRLINRAALPETELILPGACPLPAWLQEPR